MNNIYRKIRHASLAIMTVSELAVAFPALHAADTPAPQARFVGVNSAYESYDRFIVRYKDGTSERSNRNAALQSVQAALGRAGLDHARSQTDILSAQVGTATAPNISEHVHQGPMDGYIVVPIHPIGDTILVQRDPPPPHPDTIIVPKVPLFPIGGTILVQKGLRSGPAAPLTVTLVRRLAMGADLIRTSRKLNQDEANRLMVQLSADPAVAHVQPDYKMYAVQDVGAPAPVKPENFTPNDPDYALDQWHFSDPTGGANINHAWDLADGAGITVAVLDTGITKHPDLDTSLASDGYDFIDSGFLSGRGTDGRVPGGWDTGDWTNTPPWDDPQVGCVGQGYLGTPSSWHGTHVAGTVAELTNNGIGMAGTAYKAKVLPVRVLGHCGGMTSDILDAIEWASGGHVDGVQDNKHPAQVINMSLGGQGICTADSAEAIAISDAVHRGTTVVVAAGNGGVDASTFTPASCPGVISVASNGITGKRAFYSNYGKSITLSAPGGGVYENDASSGQRAIPTGFVWSAINQGSTVPTASTSYVGYAGTSQASPHVAGTVALMLGAASATGMEQLTPAQIKSLLIKSARPFPMPTDQPMGAGILDAYNAVKMTMEGGGWQW